jgi:hypothetical protein
MTTAVKTKNSLFRKVINSSQHHAALRYLSDSPQSAHALEVRYERHATTWAKYRMHETLSATVAHTQCCTLTVLKTNNNLVWQGHATVTRASVLLRNAQGIQSTFPKLPTKPVKIKTGQEPKNVGTTLYALMQSISYVR